MAEIKKISRNTRILGSVGKGNFNRSLRAQTAKILKDYTDFIRDMEERVFPAAIHDAMIPVFEESQRLVPVDKGPLKASGFLDVGVEAGKPTVRIGYGAGGFPSYAIAVHERTDLHHESPTQAKFLEAALDSQIFAFMNRVVKNVSAGMK